MGRARLPLAKRAGCCSGSCTTSLSTSLAFPSAPTCDVRNDSRYTQRTPCFQCTTSKDKAGTVSHGSLQACRESLHCLGSSLVRQVALATLVHLCKADAGVLRVHHFRQQALLVAVACLDVWPQAPSSLPRHGQPVPQGALAQLLQCYPCASNTQSWLIP